MSKHITTANKSNPKHSSLIDAKTGVAENSISMNSNSVGQTLSLKMKSFEWIRVGGKDNPYNHFLLPMLIDLFQTRKVSEFNLKSLAAIFPISCQPLLILDRDVVSPGNGAPLPLNEIRELVNSNNVDQCVSKIRVSNNSPDNIYDTMEFFGGATLGSSHLIVGAMYDAAEDRNCEMTSHLQWLSRQISSDLCLLNNLFSRGDVTKSTALVENATGIILWRPNEDYKHSSALNELLKNAQKVMGAENQNRHDEVWNLKATRQITLVSIYEKDDESKGNNKYRAIRLKDNHKGAIRSIARIVATNSFAHDSAALDTDILSTPKKTRARLFTERSLISLSQNTESDFQDPAVENANRVARHLRAPRPEPAEDTEREILKRKVAEFTEFARLGNKVKLKLKKTKSGASITLESNTPKTIEIKNSGEIKDSGK